MAMMWVESDSLWLILKVQEIIETIVANTIKQFLLFVKSACTLLFTEQQYNSQMKLYNTISVNSSYIYIYITHIQGTNVQIHIHSYTS